MNKAKNIEKRKASSPRRQSQLDTSITHGQARIEIHKLCDLGFIKKRGQVFRDYRIYTVKNNESYYFPNNFPYLCRKMKIKNYQIVILELPNGQTRHIPMREFDYYAYPNELEHKEENIYSTPHF